MKKCRLCHNIIEVEASLSMSSFPKAAQYYPTKEEFLSDNGITLDVYQCPYCNLLQLCGKSVPYYKEVITAASFSPKARAARLQEFTDFIHEHNLMQKKIIEVGCGKGGMIEILNEIGIQAVGIEYSEESVVYATDQGRNVFQGYLTELDVSHVNKYDAFISLNYIEHQPDTKAFIQALYNITKEDAVGYITAPNVNYLLQTNTLYEFVADHLVYFTEETMQRAFEINGFDILHSEIINNNNDIALTLKKRKLKKIEGIQDVEKLIKELKFFVDNEQKASRDVAIWGAGHRTLALLSMANLTNLSVIVDSADFKQGKYSPVTHLKIISPLEFENSTIETIIVMLPGLYPDEVIQHIKTFERKINTFKLQDNTLVEV